MLRRISASGSFLDLGVDRSGAGGPASVGSERW